MAAYGRGRDATVGLATQEFRFEKSKRQLSSPFHNAPKRHGDGDDDDDGRVATRLHDPHPPTHQQRTRRPSTYRMQTQTQTQTEALNNRCTTNKPETEPQVQVQPAARHHLDMAKEKKRSFIGLRFQTHERLTDQIHDGLFPTRIRRPHEFDENRLRHGAPAAETPRTAPTPWTSFPSCSFCFSFFFFPSVRQSD